MNPKKLTLPLLAAATAAALSGVTLATAPAAQAAPRDKIPHTKPGWVDHASATGDVAGKTASTFRVYLQPKGGQAALDQAVSDVSTPGTATYGDYLTPAQYHAAYDPTAGSVKTLTKYLKGYGLTVTSVEASRRYVEVSGTTAGVEKAFSTTIKAFTHDGQDVRANTTQLALPDSVSSLVLTVTGLDTTTHTMKPQTSTPAPPPAGFVNARPCSAFYGQLAASTQADYKTPLPKFQGKTIPFSVCGYTGPQFRAAYEGANPKGLTGAGVTIGVLDAYASPTAAADANTYAVNHGDGAYTSGQYTEITPSAYTHEDECDPSGWSGEEALDIEAEHAMAPDANIRYYAAASCYDDDFLAALAKIADEDKVSVVSNSWGEPDQGETTESIAAYNQVFQQASLEGISVLFSSGDNGDELQNTGLKQADSPASNPYVTAVGGTAAAIDVNGAMAFQTGWGTQKYSLSTDAKSWTPVGYLYGAGGGNSNLFNTPSYQKGVVPSSYSGRAVPDISMDADPTTGMLIGQTQTFSDGVRYGEYRIGGTSLASPLMAGEVALLIQNNGRDLGLLNPAIYGQLNKAKFVSDVAGTAPDAGNVRVDYANGENADGGLLYSVRTFNQDSTLALATGWDPVTGIGSPNAGFINAKIKKK
jgi:subtilase family serine protease